MLMIFTHEYVTKISPSQMDGFGHVNNAQYLQMFEAARWEWISPWGGTWNLVKELGIGPIVIEIQIQFLRELKVDENIVIKSKREGALRKLFKIHHEIINSENQLASKATYRMGFMDLTQRRLVEPPPLWREVFHGQTILNKERTNPNDS